ncbi:Early endosome antigen 1-like [Oopsacas minuta]|uniref:Early endosome antigen 1-like n=1 Tax=Oopsacas minuta TaxID=111878 RepID=A0AAV7JL52_9METZ|nr:Early endosome antigen 1-like [Oopsacas minuta]
MINKIREVGGKLKERSQSILSLSGSESGASYHGYGFLCPECKQSFPESETLQSHWLACMSKDCDTFVPQNDTLDMENMEIEDIKDLLTQTRKENKILHHNNQEIIRKSGAICSEVARLQNQLEDETLKSTSLQEMSVVLQETYLAQVKRNEEFCQLLEQRSMESPDDVHVLTKELSRLHATLSEKEAEWESRADSQSDHRIQIERCQRALTDKQLEVGKLTNQIKELVTASNQLTEQLTNQKAETNKLIMEKEFNQTNVQISDQLERCLAAVSADKQEIFEKIGTEALSGALSDRMVQQIQSDLSESRMLTQLERESADQREQQLIDRQTNETREREIQLTELRNKNETLREGNEQLRIEVLTSKQRETELTNQIQVLREEQTNQLTASNQKSAHQQKLLTELTADKQLIENKLAQEQSKSRDLELELETARTDFIELNRLIDEKERELERTISRAQKSEEDLNNTLELKKSLSNQILEMDCVTQELRDQLEAKNNSCSEQEKEIDRLIELTNQMSEQLEAGRDEIKKQTEEHESVKSLLIEQKLELQNRISLVENLCEGLESQLTTEKKEKAIRLANLQKELQQSQDTADKLNNQSNALKEALEKEKTLSQLTRTNLQQDISSLRDDVRAGEVKRTDLQDKLDSQFGRMAVLDAKLQSMREENQDLIGQQIQRDESIEEYKQKIHKLEIELGDTKSALYELAQENQKQAIKEARIADRKWQEDTLAVSCNECHKKFSLSIRKHHCRGCGQIYCQDCTQKQADLPGYKTRVRVCENCYKERYN